CFLYTTKVAFKTCYYFFLSRIITLRRRIDVDEKKFQRVLGKLIRKYRRQNQLTIEEVAEKVDMDEKHLSKLENGKHNPTSITLFKLIAVLDIPCDFVDDLKKEVKNLLQVDLYIFLLYSNQSYLKAIFSPPNSITNLTVYEISFIP